MRAGPTLLAAALSVFALGATRASAFCRMTTSQRAPTIAEPCVLPDMNADPPEFFLEWRRPCTSIALSVERPPSSMTEEQVYAVLDRSIATWEGVSCGGSPVGIQIAVLSEQSTCIEPLYRDGGGNVNAVMFIDDWTEREYDSGAFALTTVWHRRSTGEILDADMEINELRGPYEVCPPMGCTEDRGVDLENVITHELGHYLGLAHSTNMDATMFASAVAGETIKRDLDADDVEGLCAVYPPGSPAGECEFTPRGGLDLGCDEGCNASGVGRGGSAVWLGLLGVLGLLMRRRQA